MPHLAQSRSLRRWSSQPITWLPLPNKTVQENKLTKQPTLHNKPLQQNKTMN